MIVLSYKSQDETFADNLHEQLAIAFGNHRVIKGVKRLVKPGDDFIDAIEAGIRKADVLLILMGQNWLGDWLNDPEDPDITAIQTALQAQKRVIPILINDTPLPPANHLPGSINALTRRSSLNIRMMTFNQDVDSLVDVLKGMTQPSPQKQQSYGEMPPYQQPYGGMPPQQPPPYQQPYSGMPPQQPPPFGYNFTPPPSSTMYETTFIAAMMYPTRDKEFFAKILVGALFIIIPLIGPLVMLGYTIRYGRYILADKPGLPFWDDFGGDLGRGFTAIIGLGLLNILLGIAYFLGIYGIMLLFPNNIDLYYYSEPDPIVMLGFLGLSAVYGWVVCIANISALASYIASDRFGSLVDIGRHLGACLRIGDGIGLFFSLLIYGIIGGILIAFGYVFLILPGLMASAWFNMGSAMFSARWAMRNGYPLEVPPDRMPPAYYGNPY